MEVRPTSIAAYYEIERHLTPARFVVWDKLYELGPSTGRELNRALQSQNAHKRLSELVRQGMVVEHGTRICKVTGREAVQWVALTNRLPLSLEKQRLPKSWVTRLNRLKRKHPEYAHEITTVARLLQEG